jgi:hypothetical protein
MDHGVFMFALKVDCKPLQWSYLGLTQRPLQAGVVTHLQKLEFVREKFNIDKISTEKLQKMLLLATPYLSVRAVW